MTGSRASRGQAERSARQILLASTCGCNLSQLGFKYSELFVHHLTVHNGTIAEAALFYDAAGLRLCIQSSLTVSSGWCFYSDKGDVLLHFLCYSRGHEGLLLISRHVAIYNANSAVLVLLYCPFSLYYFHSNLHRVLRYK